MSLLETLISSIAPYECMSCAQQGSSLCEACALDRIQRVPTRCFRCLKRTADFKTCTNCRRQVVLHHVWPASEYTESLAEVIQSFKYGRARALARPLSAILDDSLPHFAKPPTVVPVPTAPARIRARGYDHAALLAKQLALVRGWKYMELLRRQGVQRQVGASRITRLTQLETAFRAIRPSYIKNAEVLLIDDVVTTGATITAAAKALKTSGAKNVSAAVLAHNS